MATLLYTKGILLLYASQWIARATEQGKKKKSLFIIQNVCSLSDTQGMNDSHNHEDFECYCDRCFGDNSLKNPGKMFTQ